MPRTERNPREVSGGDAKGSGGDVSYRALVIARLVDRTCRFPGEFTIKLVIPAHSRAPWTVEVSRVERIRSLEVDRRGST